MVDVGAVYRQIRQHLVAELATCTVDERARPVPAAPDWSVHDVLAHVVGLAAALNAQHFPEADDAGGVAWNDAQVAARSDRSIAELAQEWEVEGPTFEDGLRLFGYEFGSHFVADLLTHLIDVRQALGRPVVPDDEAVAVALDHYLGFLDEQLTAARWGGLAVITGPRSWVIGDAGGAPARASVTASPFDLLRSFSARRTLDQIRALAWQGEVEAALAFLEATYHDGYSLPTVALPPDR